MTLQHTPRRQDQPPQIGPRHGYRFEGDHVFINAQLEIPPYHSSEGWALELWARDQPYREGPLTGTRVAQVALELPTPIGPYVHSVEARTAARPPLQGRAHSMVLAVVQHPQNALDGDGRVHAFANYARTETFSAPHFAGTVSYGLEGDEVVLAADGIFNPRPRENLSGTLALELWAFPVSEPAAEGWRLAAVEVAPVGGQESLPAIEHRTAFSEPPVGHYRLALLLDEWTVAHGYVTRDRRDFRVAYQRSEPAVLDSSEARSPAGGATPARSGDRLRLVAPALSPEPTAQPEVASAAPAPEAQTPSSPSPASVAVESVVKAQREAARPAARGLVSIQAATAEELAAVKGLNLKLAKEIIKARPFASVADLIRVRGLGQKTVDRLKGLVTL